MSLDKTERLTIDAFGGYDTRLTAPVGAASHMTNLSSRHAPLLATRLPRALLREAPAFGGFAKGGSGVIFLQGGRLYVDGRAVEGLCLGEGKKSLWHWGTRILIYPDGVYYDTVRGKVGTLDEKLLLYEYRAAREIFLSATGEPVVREFSFDGGYDEEGEWQGAYRFHRITDSYPYYTEVDDETGEEWESQMTDYRPEVGHIAVETDTDGHYRYGEGGWQPLTVEYLIARLPHEDVQPYVTAGASWPMGKGSGAFLQVDRLVDFTLLAADPATGYSGFDDVYLKADRPLVYDEYCRRSSPWYYGRWRPTPTHRLVAGDRVWSCYEGYGEGGAFLNEIRCHTPDDDESIRLPVSVPGPFTGAVAFGDSVFFFKENAMLRVMGNAASGYRVITTPCCGVAPDAADSLVVLDDAMYYRSSAGVMRCDGGLPKRIDAPLGDGPFSGGVAGTLGDKLYLGLTDGTGRPSLLVYDTAHRMWHREDELAVTHLHTAHGHLFYVADGRMGLINGEPIAPAVAALFGEPPGWDGDFLWDCQLTDMGHDSPDPRYLRSLTLRASVAEGGYLEVAVMPDSCGTWQTVGLIGPRSMGRIRLPVSLAVCDHMRLRLSGKGACIVRSLYGESERVEGA